MKPVQKSMMVIIGLIAVTCLALTMVNAECPESPGNKTPTKCRDTGSVSLNIQLVQNKVLKGSNGRVALCLNLSAGDTKIKRDAPDLPLDLVLVLDRSGSMSGQKISDAKLAAARLLDRLTEKDRLAVITYANGVTTRSSLVAVDEKHRSRLADSIRRITAGGGTNLGGGLKQGIDTLGISPSGARQRKIILISDGLANQGVTDPFALGRMASAAVKKEFSISTVGVGLDFNELVMTTIADHGTGNYYFMENPAAFAAVFEQELQQSRQVAASDLELRITLPDGVRLVDAGGYPITYDNNTAVVRPGVLLPGQQRRLFLTVQVPTDKERKIRLGHIALNYRINNRQNTISSKTPMNIACVADPNAVMASIDKETWSKNVTEGQFNQLREEVSTAIRKGDISSGRSAIDAYVDRNKTINSTLASSAVTDNLEKDVKKLRESLTDTFAGSPAEVEKKQKQQAKAMQYESYRIRRGK